MDLVRAIGLLACLAAVAQAEEKARPVECYVRIGHYQCMCRQGDFEANLKTVLHGLELAEQACVQIMTFPESFLTGYFGQRDDAWKHSFAVELLGILRQTLPSEAKTAKSPLKN
jgi:predicted amidohydrolase